MKKTLCLVALALLFAAPPLAAADRLTFDDLYGMPRPSDPRISPDGKRIAFVVRENDVARGKALSHIWIMGADGSAAHRVTTGEKGESAPRFTPDGKAISFGADRDGAGQFWLLPLADGGGEARKLTALATGASGLEWSKRAAPGAVGSFLFVSSVYPDCPDDACNRKRREQAEADPVKARLYDRLLYRHYNAWDKGTVPQLFFVEDASRAPGAPRNLHPGREPVPTGLLGGSRDYDLSPDGKEVAFVKSVGDEPAVWPNNEISTVPTAGGEAVRATTNPGLDVTPRYSPDGRLLAWIEMARAGYESDQTDLIVRDRASGTDRNLTRDFDRSVGEYLWAPDAKSVYFTAIDHGMSQVYRVQVASGKVDTLLKDAVYGDIALSPDGRFLVMTRSRANEPHEIWRYDLATSKLTRLTHLTAEATKRLELPAAEEFWFTGALGDRVHGFLTRPPGFDSTRKYPMVLLIHGGPQWCWLGDFNTYGWSTQLMAAQGYVVAQIDPHGSVGYGLKFTDYVSGHWGIGDYEDLMKGVDHLLVTHEWIDGTRMAALGRSYGGFMINWICGHTDRFKALVTIDGTYEHVSEYGSTEELWFPEWENKGTPWTNREEYVRSSPATYAANFKTPTMVIHGQEDYRVDLSQGLAMFTALRRQGVPAELVYFPDEGHAVGKLANLRFVYEKQLAWLARWLK